MVKRFLSNSLLRECYAAFVFHHSCLVAGVMYALPACLTPQLKEEGYHVDAFMQSVLGTIPTFCTVFMTFVILIIIGRGGRKMIQQICFIVLIVCLVIIIFSTNIWCLCCGLAVSFTATSFCTPLTSAYVSETCQKERRGVLLAMAFICFSCGNAIIFILNLFLTWRGIVAVEILLSLSGFIQMFFIPETKYWHLVEGDVDSARRSILWFQPDLSAAEVDGQIKAMQQSLESNTTSKGRLSALFQHLKNKRVRKPLLIGFLANLFRSGEGRVVFSVHFFDIFEELDVPYDLKKWSAFYGAVYLVCVVGVVAVTRALKRKIAVYLWAGVMAGCLTIMIVYKFLHNAEIDIPPWIPVVAGYLYFLLSTSGLYSAVYTIVIELQVAYCRPQMSAILNGQVSVCFSVYTFIFPYVKMFLPIEYIFLAFLFNLMATTVIIYAVMPETSSFEFYDTLDKQKANQSGGRES